MSLISDCAKKPKRDVHKEAEVEEKLYCEKRLWDASIEANSIGNYEAEVQS